MIPAKIRRELGWKIGDDIVFQLDNGELKMMTREQARKWAQDFVRSLVPPGVSMVDELIRERREEAARE